MNGMSEPGCAAARGDGDPELLGRVVLLVGMISDGEMAVANRGVDLHMNPTV